MGIVAISFTVDITCEECQKEAQVEGGGQWEDIEGDVMITLEQEGWVLIKGSFLCESCSEKERI